VLTFQVLVAATLPEDLGAGLKALYVSACAALLRTVGLAAADGAWPTLVGSAATAFVDMLHVLSAAVLVRLVDNCLRIGLSLTQRQIEPLTALLRLLGDLCFTLPDFSAAILVAKREDEGAANVVFSLATTVQLVSEKAKPETADGRCLLEAFMTLVEGLLWDVSNDQAEA
jgi:hypothetical protein